ncbi:glycosyltransferase family 5 protein [Collybiopsis luxurians FD-317 M1]|uniref:Glycosyltransferase family 5 protein n=1 Tax=Collybiopsis luxurians FD-317 M1 TaxID=944289 RepID=A0A0D0BEJ6_9AGAR|nr:glycosyltransferase family 5 protein [Collybiopsis luxurians FD-317 M1]
MTRTSYTSTPSTLQHILPIITHRQTPNAFRNDSNILTGGPQQAFILIRRTDSLAMFDKGQKLFIRSSPDVTLRRSGVIEPGRVMYAITMSPQANMFAVDTKRSYIFARTSYHIIPSVNIETILTKSFGFLFESLVSLRMFAQALTPLERRRTSRSISSATLAWGLKTRLEEILDTLRRIRILQSSPKSYHPSLFSTTSMVSPIFPIDDRLTMFNMLNRYFWPHCAAYQSFLAQVKKLLESRNAPESYDAFGVQRLTEDDLLPGAWLKIPILIALGTLKHTALDWEGLGETLPEVVASSIVCCRLLGTGEVMDAFVFVLNSTSSSDRGRTSGIRPSSISVAADPTPFMSQCSPRDPGLNVLYGCAFHYSIYRALTSFLGMDGNLQVVHDTSTDFITVWNEMFVNNDFLNAQTGVMDPRHMFGTSNFDVFRWPSLVNGMLRSALGTFVTSIVMPGLVMYYYGEEQNFYTRQAMPAKQAWKRHGCYQLGCTQYFNMPLSKAFIRCKDNRNTLDHLDPTDPTRRLFIQFNFLCTTYSAPQDGFSLIELGNWTTYRALTSFLGMDRNLQVAYDTSRLSLPPQCRVPRTVAAPYQGRNAGGLFCLQCDQGGLRKKSVGVAGHVNSFPNPDPMDIAALDEKPVKTRGIKVDPKAEVARPELKCQTRLEAPE